MEVYLKMKPKIFIARPIPLIVEEYLQQYCDYNIWNNKEPIPRNVLLESIKESQGLMISGDTVDEELLSRAPNLKIVSNISVGYNNLDLKIMKAKGVIGTNTPYVLDDTVADLIMGLILSCGRRIPELDRYVRGKKWDKDIDHNCFGLDIHHSTLGIIGMGRIGEAVAKRAKFGFDMEVLYHNRKRKYDSENLIGAKSCTLEELLIKSDYVVIMTPLTIDTHHLMNYEQFSLMKKTAIFINASRGQTVNEEALIDALTNKKIYGAGLDVYDKEPIELSNPLLKMSNVVILPHIGTATEKTRMKMAMRAAQNIITALNGEIPPDIINE